MNFWKSYVFKLNSHHFWGIVESLSPRKLCDISLCIVKTSSYKKIEFKYPQLSSCVHIEFPSKPIKPRLIIHKLCKQLLKRHGYPISHSSLIFIIGKKFTQLAWNNNDAVHLQQGSYQIFWSIMFEKQIPYLLKSPFCCWTFSYIEMDDLPPVMFYYNKDMHQFKVNRGDSKKIN